MVSHRPIGSASRHSWVSLCGLLFFFNDTATTEIYTLSLHDALPISYRNAGHVLPAGRGSSHWQISTACSRDRKSTRLNSSHSQISYAVFCLKKKKTITGVVEMVIRRPI